MATQSRRPRPSLEAIVGQDRNIVAAGLLQDLALLQTRTQDASRETVLAEVVRRYNGTSLADWRNTAPALTKKPVLEWNNVNIDEALASFHERFSKLQPDAWLRVRDYALTEARQVGSRDSSRGAK